MRTSAAQVAQSTVVQSSPRLAQTGNNNDITQTQNLTQRNANDEDMFATAVAVSGDVEVARQGIYDGSRQWY